jgi:Ser/Thr protein kinase RdoA (MazF antagonist)
MERIDARLHNWKGELLSGRVEVATAHRVGELLGRLHARSSQRLELATEFANRVYFEELRVEPFFTRVAARNPQLSEHIALAVNTLREPGIAMVHGDYSPKNLLVAGRDVVILDLEVAHWGNPRFDVAFCLTHLLLKGLRRDAHVGQFANAIAGFIDGYRGTGLTILDASMMRMLGCLMLARFEGASPVDYRDQLDAAHVKRIASRWIRDPRTDVDRSIQAVLVSRAKA